MIQVIQVVTGAAEASMGVGEHGREVRDVRGGVPDTPLGHLDDEDRGGLDLGDAVGGLAPVVAAVVHLQHQDAESRADGHSP